MIMIYANECLPGDIYLKLKLKSVQWSTTAAPTVIAGDVPHADYNAYHLSGGKNRIDPPRGQYSPAYLDMPAAGTAYTSGNFDVKLVISGEDS